MLNSSLEFDICPKDWKNSIIHHAPKVPGTNKCEEFRPTNTPPTYEKVLETAVKVSLEEHLMNNSIIIDKQSGSRKVYSLSS